MKNLYSENQGTNTYLVYAVTQDDELDTLSLGMMTNNSIPGLAETVYTQMNDQKYIKYNISSKISAKQFLQGEVTRKRLLGVFASVIDAYLSSEDYMILPESLMLDLDYIYVDVSTNEAVMICMPLLSSDNTGVDLKSFFREIMFNTKFDQRENCDYVARIINYLNGSPVFAIDQFKKVLTECNADITQNQPNIAKQEIAATQPVIVNKQTPSDMEAQKPVQPTVAPNTVMSNHQDSMIQPVVHTNTNVNAAKTKPQVVKSAKPTKQNVAPPTNNGSSAVASDGGQDISLFYLLQHYNKDNAAAYKAQKAAKKEGKASADQAIQTPPTQSSAAPKANLGFAIPGQVQMPSGQPKQAAATVAPSANVLQNAVPVQNTQPAQNQPQISTKPANFGNTTVLNTPQSNATTVLDPSVMPGMSAVQKPYLIRKKNNETIPIDKNDFRLGKERSFVDYFIGDNTAISRSHACIVCRDHEYYVMDTNSTNHTFVNDIMIQSNVETKLESGAKIRLADEEFEFKMM